MFLPYMKKGHRTAKHLNSLDHKFIQTSKTYIGKQTNERKSHTLVHYNCLQSYCFFKKLFYLLLYGLGSVTCPNFYCFLASWLCIQCVSSALYLIVHFPMTLFMDAFRGLLHTNLLLFYNTSPREFVKKIKE